MAEVGNEVRIVEDADTDYDAFADG